MAKHYDQYCPMAHALELVGERWSLLVVRELLHGPRRYTDLAANLPNIGTNILASRLKSLEACGIVSKRRLPPPAASQVYELTPYGQALKPLMRELAVWGLRSLGRPGPDDVMADGWLESALDVVFAPMAPPGSLEFRISGEVATIVDGVARAGSVESPDVLVEGEVAAMYDAFVEDRWDGLSVEGDRELVEQLFDAVRGPAAAAAASA